MFRGSILSVFAVLTLVGFGAHAGSEQKAVAFVLCKNQKDVRTIRVLPQSKDNCTVTYSKGGVEEVVGANRSVQTCRSILKSVQVNLESSRQWKCRNVQTALLTTSKELTR